MSKLEKIKAKLAAILLQFATIKTDKAVLEYDGEELAVNADVFVTNEDGERTPAEDGEYTTEDGTVITVANGKVVSILEKEDDVEPEAEPETEVEAEEEKPAEETEEETGEDAPKEDEVKEEEELEDENADKLAELEEKVDKLAKLVEEILVKIGEDNTEVEARLSKIEKMSMAQPAQEAFETSTTTKSSVLTEKQSKRVAEMNKDWRKM